MEFMEEARWVVLEKYIGLERMQAKRIIFVVVNINVNFRKTVSMGDRLELYLGLNKIGSKSAVFHQEIRLKGKDTVVSDAKVTFVFADADTGKAVRIDDEIKTLLEELKT
jgi:thioesterase-3